MKKAQYKQCKSSGVTGNILENVISVVSLMYAIGRCWKQALKTHRMDGGWSQLFQWLSETKSFLSGSILWSLGAAWVFFFLPPHFSNSISSTAHRGSSRPAILGNWWGEDRQFPGDLASALGWGRATQTHVDSSLWREDSGGELWLKHSKNWSQTCFLEVGCLTAPPSLNSILKWTWELVSCRTWHGIWHFISIK